ncbi:hypothetical protein DRI38_004767 [Escherichia coli]|nr:hypothetical protein [Escherichia coli]
MAINEGRAIKQARASEARSPAFTVMCGGIARNKQALDGFNQTDNLAIFFDSVESVHYSLPVEKSSFAVEDGTTKSDHALLKDRTISFTGRVTSAPHIIRKENYIDRNTDPNNPVESMRPMAAVKALEEIRNKRQLVSIITEDAGLLEDFILTKCDIKRSSSEGDCIVVDCEFSEFRTFQIRTVEDAGVFTDPKKTGRTQQKGAVNSSEKDSNVQSSKVQKLKHRGEYQKGEIEGKIASGDNTVLSNEAHARLVDKANLLIDDAKLIAMP